jgi:hypothetical protein
MVVSKFILRDPFMKSYAARLKSYEDWSLTFMNKDEMAAAGFYFTGYGDMLRCPFCKILVGYWKAGYNAFVSHNDVSRDFYFINGEIHTDSDGGVRCGCGYKH